MTVVGDVAANVGAGNEPVSTLAMPNVDARPGTEYPNDLDELGRLKMSTDVPGTVTPAGDRRLARQVR